MKNAKTLPGATLQKQVHVCVFLLTRPEKMPEKEGLDAHLRDDVLKGVESFSFSWDGKHDSLHLHSNGSQSVSLV